MKKVNLLRLVTRGAVAFILMLSLGFSLNAQYVVPDGVNYQSIVRDATTGNPLANTQVFVKVDIMDGAALVSTETFGPLITNDFGLVNLVIGAGVDWGTIADPMIEVFVDIGAGFVSMGVTAVQSVPYAAVAGNAAYYDGTDIVFGDGTTLYVAPDGTPGTVEPMKTVVVNGNKDIYGFNNVGIEGALTLGGNLDVANTGTVYIRNNEGATSVNTGALRITGGLAAGNDSYFGQDLVVGGDLNVMGDGNFENNLNVMIDGWFGGDLYVDGMIYGNITGDGWGTWYGYADLLSLIAGDATVDYLTVNQIADIWIANVEDLNAMYLDASYADLGQANVTNNLNVGGQITTESIIGDYGTFMDLTVTGTLDVANFVIDDLVVNNTATIYSLDAEYGDIEYLDVYELDVMYGAFYELYAEFANIDYLYAMDLSADDAAFYNLTVENATELATGPNGYLNVYGVTKVIDATPALSYGQGALQVTGGGSFGGNLFVGESLWVQNNVDIGNQLQVGDRLFVNEESDLFGEVHIWSQNNSTCDDPNEYAFALEVDGGARIDMDLCVGGDATIAGTLYVPVINTDEIYVASLLDVDGQTFLDHLQVDGVASFNDYAYFNYLTYFYDNVYFNDPATFNDYAYFNAPAYFYDPVYVYDNFYTNGTSTFDGNVYLNATTYFNIMSGTTFYSDFANINTLEVDDNFYSLGNSYLMDTWVDGDLEVDGNVHATGTLSSGSTLILDGTYTLNNWSIIDDDVFDLIGFAGDDLADIDELYADNGFFNTAEIGDLTVTGYTDLQDGEAEDWTVNGDLTVVGFTLLDDVEVQNLWVQQELDVDGNAQFDADIEVLGVATFSNPLDGTATGGAVQIPGGGLHVGLNTWMGGSLTVSQNATIGDNLTVQDASNLFGNVHIYDTDNSVDSQSGALIVDGGTGIALDLNVGGVIKTGNTLILDGTYQFKNWSTIDDETFNLIGFEGDDLADIGTIFTTNIDISGDAQIDGNLNVDGLTTLDDTQVDGPFTVNGFTDLNGGLNVQDGAVFQSTVNVQGDADFDANVNVDGDFNVGGTTTLDETTVDGTFTVNGFTDLNGQLNVQDAAVFQSTVNVQGTADFDQDVNMDGNLQVDLDLNVDGATTLDATTVDGLFTVNGDSDLNGMLDVQDATTLQSTLNVQGTADFDQDVNMDGNLQVDLDLNVDGATTLDETTIDGLAKVNGDLDVNAGGLMPGNITAEGTITSGSSITIDGTTAGYGTIYETSDDLRFDDADLSEINNIDIDGNAQVTGDFNVDGVTTLDETTVDGTLDVTGDVSITSSTPSTSPSTGALTVAGGVGIGENLWVNDDAWIIQDFNVGGTSFFTGNATFGGASVVFVNNTANILFNPGPNTAQGGAFIVDGGGRVAKDFYVGGTWYAGGGLFFGPVHISDNTPSTNSSTGALTVVGGIGTLNNLNAAGTVASGNTLILDGTYGSGNYSIIDDVDYGLIDFTGDDLQNIGTLTADELIANSAVITDVTVGNDLSVTNDFYVDGMSYLDNTEVDGTLNVTGTSTFGGDVTINANLTVTGTTTLATVNITTATIGTLTVTGTATIFDLDVTTNIDAATLAVSGASSFAGIVSITNSTATTTATPLTGALQVTGGISSGNNISAAGALASGATIIIDGTTAGYGTIYESSDDLRFDDADLSEIDDLDMDGNLTVGGNGVFTGDVTAANGNFGTVTATTGNITTINSTTVNATDVNATTVNATDGNFTGTVDATLVTADGGIFTSLEAVEGFKTSGAVYSHIVFATGAYVVDSGPDKDHVIISTSASSVQLPAITAAEDGRILVIKNNSGALMSIIPDGGGDLVNVDGTTYNPYTLGIGYNVNQMTLISDFASGQWYAIDK